MFTLLKSKPLVVPKQLLVTRTDKIGDLLTSLPALQLYKKSFPTVKVHLLAQATPISLLTNHPAIDQLWPITRQNRQSLSQEIIAQQFDCCISLVWDSWMNYLAKPLSKIPMRIAPLSKLGAFWWSNQPKIQHRSSASKTEAEYNADLFKPLGLPNDPLPPAHIAVHLTDLENLQQALHAILKTEDLHWLDQPFVVIHAGMGGSALNWQKDYYAWVIQQLAEIQVCCCLTGLEQEHAHNLQLIRRLTPKAKPWVKNIGGNLSLRQLAALLHLAKVFLGPSTGPTHLAQAVGTKIVALYSPIQVQSATRWQPYGFEGHVLTPKVHCGQKNTCLGPACKDYFCLDSISPNLVLQHIRHLLNT